ncbi:competence/damage-inducible protein A [Senegalia massiliensis]|uniref:competence/damage-inducible protein A n=1 Tax=Senegalia massiliensis TaxID=1720316 RepID=UPI00102F7CBA|nr:competence/damage-inducible protein A [Senegalia massiliensis]
MDSIIINIGDEILDGDILNTNGQYISRNLKDINISVKRNHIIKDEINSIVEITKKSLKDSDIVIITGGLGPTDDDITREAVSKALNYNLYLDEVLLQNLELKFSKNNYIMTKNNIKQAYRIENSTVIPNEKGTAPGMFIKKNNKYIFLLPGPPKELKSMFDRIVEKHLQNLSDKKIYSKTIKTIGIGESQLEEKIKPYFSDNIKIGTYAYNGIVDIKITSYNKILSQAKENVDKFLESINIEKFIWGYDDDTLEKLVFDLLKKHRLKIGFAESLTGGLISSKFTKLSGISEVFPLGLVTYSNESKINLLDVKKLTLQNHGAVSEKVALEMCTGLINKYNLDISLSVTGIAGPTGNTKNKPIGLVYIGIADKNNSLCKKIVLNGDRIHIQNKTSLYAFNELRKFLIKKFE